jgi:bifunctional non-homologous end joining protein LigD
MKRTESELKVDGKTLKLSNLEKVFYPETGFRKADLIDYYIRIAPVILPYLEQRPLTLKRYPDGVSGEYFYEKQCPSHKPKFVETSCVYSKAKRHDICYCLANDLPSLLWAVNLASIEMHVFLARKPRLELPTMMVFDLDPGEPADVMDCARVAIWLREALDGLKLKAFPKTSGSKGLQVFVPLNTAVSYDDTKPFAHAIAQLLERYHPKHVVSKMEKRIREGKVFVDWSQNEDFKTTIAAYSLRAKTRPFVSTPLEWDEVELALKRNNADSLRFDNENIFKRLDKHGDLFEPVLKLEQQLPKLE